MGLADWKGTKINPVKTSDEDYHQDYFNFSGDDWENPLLKYTL